MLNISSEDVKVFFPKYDVPELVKKLRTALSLISKNLRLTDARLFGSYVTGNYTAHSDIDVLAAIDGNDKRDAYSRCWDASGIPELELHVYTAIEIEKMGLNGNPFLGRVMKDSIELLGRK